MTLHSCFQPASLTPHPAPLQSQWNFMCFFTGSTSFIFAPRPCRSQHHVIPGQGHSLWRRQLGHHLSCLQRYGPVQQLQQPRPDGFLLLHLSWGLQIPRQRVVPSGEHGSPVANLRQLLDSSERHSSVWKRFWGRHRRIPVLGRLVQYRHTRELISVRDT